MVVTLPIARRGKPPAHALGAVNEYGIYSSARELVELPEAVTADPNFSFAPLSKGSLGARMRLAVGLGRREDSNEARAEKFLAVRAAQQIISEVYLSMLAAATIDPAYFAPAKKHPNSAPPLVSNDVFT
jgi:hypothetical protein